MGDRDEISAWVDFNFDLYSALALGDIEGKLAYEHRINRTFALGVEFDPTLSPENDYGLSTQISVLTEISL